VLLRGGLRECEWVGVTVLVVVGNTNPK
jgi:hypothetical protein